MYTIAFAASILTFCKPIDRSFFKHKRYDLIKNLTCWTGPGQMTQVNSLHLGFWVWSLLNTKCLVFIILVLLPVLNYSPISQLIFNEIWFSILMQISCEINLIHTLILCAFIWKRKIFKKHTVNYFFILKIWTQNVDARWMFRKMFVT